MLQAVGASCQNSRMPSVDGAALRDLLYSPLVSGTHSQITDQFHALGLVEPDADQQGTKSQRVSATLAVQSPEELRRVAQALLEEGNLDAERRNRIQDVLWDGQGPAVWERTRRSLAAALDIDDLVIDKARFEAVLDRWWVLGFSGPFEGLLGRDVSPLSRDLGFG